MEEKSIKAHFDRKVLLTFLIVFVVGAGLLSFKLNRIVDCTAVDFDVISSSYTTEDLIEFKSNDPSGFEWEWDFGDETEGDFRANVVHQFEKPGVYKVHLQMNNNCTLTKDVTIKPKEKVVNPELVPEIDAPRSVRVGDLVEFTNSSEFANSWEWSFGETASVDSRDQNPKYIFKTPGKKTILLLVNEDSKHGARHQITVLPAKQEERKRVVATRQNDYIEEVLKDQVPDAPVEDPMIADAPPEEPKEKKPEIVRIEIAKPKLTQLLMDYSERRSNDAAIRKYLCTSNIPVFNSTGKKFDIGTFLREIRDKKIEIEDIRMYKSKTKGCLKSFTVDMKVKKGLFWKTF